MSIVTPTGRTRLGTCSICDSKVTEEEFRSLDGTHWSPTAHRAPCGGHCMGGGVDHDETDVHIITFGKCPRCGETADEVAEIVTNSDDSERIVFQRYTPNYRPELGFRIDHQVRENGKWVVDSRFPGDPESLDRTKQIAAIYYQWFRELLGT